MRTSRNIGLTCDVFRPDVRGPDFGIGQRRNLDWPAEIRRCRDFKRKFEIRATSAASGLTRKELVDLSISPEIRIGSQSMQVFEHVCALGEISAGYKTELVYEFSANEDRCDFWGTNPSRRQVGEC